MDSHGVVLAAVLPVDLVLLNSSNKKVPKSRYGEVGRIPYTQDFVAFRSKQSS